MGRWWHAGMLVEKISYRTSTLPPVLHTILTKRGTKLYHVSDLKVLSANIGLTLVW